MAILRSLIERRGNPFENPSRPLTDASLSELFYGRPAHSGMRVSSASSLRVIAVYSAVTLIAGTGASLPIKVYSTDTTGKRSEKRTPQAKILWGRPNPSMSRQVFWETVFGHMLLWGNAYAWKVREGSGAVGHLWPISPDRVLIKDVTGAGEKIFTVQGETGEYTRRDILHVPFFSLDGVHGLSPIGLAREGIGLAMAAEEFGARFFGQGTQLSGVIEVPGTQTKDQSLRMAVEWERAHAGMGNSHRPAILDNGASWKSVGIPPDDAQFLQTRQFQVSEIARLFRVPPHLIADVSGSTSWGTGIAEQNAGFHRYTLLPMLTRAEQEVSDDPDLLAANQTMAFDAAGLLRADVKSRSQSYTLGRNGGWLSANDIRQEEDMPPIEGGDIYLQPLNMGEAGKDGGNDTTGGAGDNLISG